MTGRRAYIAALVVAALLAPFLFTWPYAVALAFILSLAEPVAGIACGIIADALYWPGGAYGWPVGTVAGLIATGIALLVRRFVKTHIISA